MKFLKHIIIVLIGAGVLGACTKDFLDIPAQGQLTEDVYFGDEENINDALNRVYSSVNWRFFRLGWMYFITHSVAGDDVSLPSSNTNTGWSMYKDWTNDSNNWFVELMWGRWYQYINDCNQVLKLTESYDSEESNKINAQARYFRAYWHFDLVNVFGEVVLRDHVPAPEEYNIPKSSEEELYDLIIKDLEFAIENLPMRSEWGTDNRGRITIGTAKGLLAKVYLYQQDYENAYYWANQVVNEDGEYGLDASYRNLFSVDGKYSVENMMPGHYIYQNIAGRTRNPYVEYQGIPGSGLGSCFFVPSEDLVNAYEVGDPRKEATIFERGDVIEGYNQEIEWLDGENYANRKVIFPATQWPDNDFFKQELNLPFMRYADILLIYAEAANELGKSGQALDALEQIRYRARGNQSYEEAGVLPEIATSAKDEIREKIWDERRIELSLEGQRWFDLVRYEKVVPGYTTGIMNTLGRTNFNYAKHSKFPIPSAYITSSEGVLKQNSAW